MSISPNFVTYSLTDSQMQILIGAALQFAGMSSSAENTAEILGIDFGQEVGHGSIQTAFDYYYQNFCYVSPCPLVPGGWVYS